MATTKKRINITLPKAEEQAIAELAKRDQVPEATKAGELLRLALQIEEDIVFDKIANKRLKSSTKTLSHKEVWE